MVPVRLVLVLIGLMGFLSMVRKPITDKPEANRFTRVVVAEKLNEPMAMTPLDDGRVLFVERTGDVHQYNPATNRLSLLGTIPVSTTYAHQADTVREAEEGLLGIVADPDFLENHWIYLYYSDPNESKNVLARYELQGDQLVIESKKVVLEVPTQREECCHAGGGMVFDKQGNLYLLTGDNTSPLTSLLSPDKRSERSQRDAQKTASNTADLRGKLIRIHPEPTGGYSIPEGNLFAAGNPKTRPEIYGMGLRNPRRIAYDSQTGYVYWGEEGPGRRDSTGLELQGYEEFNQARSAGNFGWPYVVGNNEAYWDRDNVAQKKGKSFNPAALTNDSPDNSGLLELPAAQKALIWYSHRPSDEFPLIGYGERSAVGGPIYHKGNFKHAQRPFPDYYEGKWLVTDSMRGWIMAITLDENGRYVSMERFLPNERFVRPIDMQFAASGDLYLLEYGSTRVEGGSNARLVRIEYNGGNRKPVVHLSADKSAGAVPLKVTFSSANTIDYDRDSLSYEWQIMSKTGGSTQTFTTANPTVLFDKKGAYTARLTVTDAAGSNASKLIDINVGNEPPSVDVLLTGNKTFFFPNQSIDYAVQVADKEDGSLEGGQIESDKVSVTIDYLADRFDRKMMSNQRNATLSSLSSMAQRLINESDCRACHTVNRPAVGPTYQRIARKYRGDPTALERLARKVISGGSGIWGEATMSAHPQLSLTDASTIVTYILALPDDSKPGKLLPVSGRYRFSIPEGQSNKGVFVLRAAYLDKGTQGAPPSEAEKIVVLRSPVLESSQADTSANSEPVMTQGRPFYLVGSGAYVGYYQLDLTGIAQIDIEAQVPERVDAAGGIVEIRQDSPTGKLIGASPMISRGGAVQSATQRQSSMSQIVPTVGVHDLYFVVRNPLARPTQVLLDLSSITVRPTAATK